MLLCSYHLFHIWRCWSLYRVKNLFGFSALWEFDFLQIRRMRVCSLYFPSYHGVLSSCIFIDSTISQNLFHSTQKGFFSDCGGVTRNSLYSSKLHDIHAAHCKDFHGQRCHEKTVSFWVLSPKDCVTKLVFSCLHSSPTGVTRRQFLVNVLLDVMVQDMGFTVSLFEL